MGTISKCISTVKSFIRECISNFWGWLLRMTVLRCSGHSPASAEFTDYRNHLLFISVLDSSQIFIPDAFRRASYVIFLSLGQCRCSFPKREESRLGALLPPVLQAEYLNSTITPVWHITTTLPAVAVGATASPGASCFLSSLLSLLKLFLCCDREVNTLFPATGFA